MLLKAACSSSEIIQVFGNPTFLPWWVSFIDTERIWDELIPRARRTQEKLGLESFLCLSWLAPGSEQDSKKILEVNTAIYQGFLDKKLP